MSSALRSALPVGNNFVHVSGELVKQMVNNVSGKDLDTHLFGHLVHFLAHRHVERENSGKLSLMAEHYGGGHDVLLMHRTNVETGNGDRGTQTPQELHECLERADSRRLDVNATSGLLEK